MAEKAPEWLGAGVVTAPMARDELERYIAAFLAGQQVCVLATCGGNTPRATPIEYHARSLTLYVLAEGGRKLENIRANPRVSVGIFAPYTGWVSVKGVQITGRAKILSEVDIEDLEEGFTVYPWRDRAAEMGLSSLPPQVKLLKIVPEEIELTDMSLKARGYAARQTWRAQA